MLFLGVNSLYIIKLIKSSKSSLLVTVKNNIVYLIILYVTVLVFNEILLIITKVSIFIPIKTIVRKISSNF